MAREVSQGSQRSLHAGSDFVAEFQKLLQIPKTFYMVTEESEKHAAISSRRSAMTSATILGVCPARLYVCMHVCMYACMYVCMYVYRDIYV